MGESNVMTKVLKYGRERLKGSQTLGDMGRIQLTMANFEDGGRESRVK